MPLEKHDAVNADDADPETLLENDNSKDLKLIDEQSLTNDLANDNAEMQSQPRPEEE